MTKCVCPGCPNEVSAQLNGFLTPNQQHMIGYFCSTCIRAECKATCKRKRPA